ncbi:Ethanolamine-phosphate phospho-lyase, partial [Tetrabaena socialis]
SPPAPPLQVAAAVSAQLHTLNTNSRYLHPALPAYTAALLDTLNRPNRPNGCDVSGGSGGGGCGDGGGTAAAAGDLELLYLVCSGSEANDLALRIITANHQPPQRPGGANGHHQAHNQPPQPPLHVAVMAGAYHGHTSALLPLSPYKFWGPGGGGREPHVHVIPCPDPYRGENLDGRAAGLAVLAAARRAGGVLAGFFAESILSCGGQVVLPPGYLRDLYGVLQPAGVCCVADEVQCGFGRCGAAFWGFHTQEGALPDIVTMGKPI